jgi:hypothetical protein
MIRHADAKIPADNGVSNTRINADPGDVIWNQDAPPADNYIPLGKRLAQGGHLFRNPLHRGGLIEALADGGRPVTKGADLWPIIVDQRVHIQVVKKGEAKGREIPARSLDSMLKTELFLDQFHPIDQITQVPLYLPDFSLTKRGYNDREKGYRILYLGDTPRVSHSLEFTNKFLKQMDFATEADLANAVGAALTVLLRNHWPGGKPIIIASGTVSHSGKDTVLAFSAGVSPSVSISYQSTDWALQREFVGVVKLVPDVGMIVAENARLDRRDRVIASAYLERTATDPEPFLFSTGTGAAIRIRNGLVLAISTNHGTVNEDLLNRSLPIHLAPKGDVNNRRSDIGNPRLEYLPRHKEDIAAELRGMVEKWVAGGRKADNDARHPFSEWARTIGGILKTNGFKGFLQNYGKTRITSDPVREALGKLGAWHPDNWLKPSQWVEEIEDLGLSDPLIPTRFRESDKSKADGFGKLVAKYVGHTVEGETDSKRLGLRLEKARARFEKGGQPELRYRFDTVTEENLPEDDLPEDLPSLPLPLSFVHIDTTEDEYVEVDG